MEQGKITDGIKNRASSIRLRTYILTTSILVTLIFYILVNVMTKQAISWIDFCLLTIIQSVIYLSYFPDGEIYGAKDKKFVANHEAYNLKANQINKEHKMGKLRDYCKFEYQGRLKNYILTECGSLNITQEEYEFLKQKEPKEIKKLKSIEIDGKFLQFTRHKRKRLYNLLFKPLPVEENKAETILSAVENNNRGAIRDESPAFKKKMILIKTFQIVGFSALLAYIGFTLKDGIGLPEIVQIFMYLTTMITNAVTAYTTGEQCTKVYKTRFYVDLSNFIDGFNEWCEKN